MYGDNYNTLADWQATGKDLHRISEMPNFASTEFHLIGSSNTMLMDMQLQLLESQQTLMANRVMHLLQIMVQMKLLLFRLNSHHSQVAANVKK